MRIILFMLSLFLGIHFANGQSVFEDNGKYGIKDHKGKVLSEAIYDKVRKIINIERGWPSIDGFHKRYDGVVFEVYKAGKRGFYLLRKKKKHVIVPAEYDLIQYQIGCYALKKDDKWGILKNTDKSVDKVKFRFDAVQKFFGNGLIAVKENNKWGIYYPFADDYVYIPNADTIEFVETKPAQADLYKSFPTYFFRITKEKDISRIEVRFNRNTYQVMAISRQK